MPCAIPVLPDTNASLLEVRERSTGDSRRGAPAPGPQRWAAGDTPPRVWVEEGTEQRASKGDVSQADPSFMAIEASDDVLIGLGDTVTYRRDDGTEVSRRVQVLERLPAVGLVNVTFWES